MRIPFVGAEAVAAGLLTPSQLRHRYRAIYRGVYVPRAHEPTLHERIVGASMSTGGVIAGVAAAAMHGAKWIDDDVAVEVVGSARPQRGLLVRDEVLRDHEVMMRRGVAVTTPARTAFDLARRLHRNKAVERIDALMNASRLDIEDVVLIAKDHPRARGLKRLREALPLIDGGAESPPETRLRLACIDAGLPCPTTQFVVYDEDGSYVRRLDMAWEEFKVAAEYDGAQHLTDRDQYVLDVRVNRVLQRLQWYVVHAIKEDHLPEIVEQIRTQLLARGWRPQLARPA